MVDAKWAWAPYRPDSERPWNTARAAHLLRRAGFGFSAAGLRNAREQGPEPALDALLAKPATLPEFDAKMAALSSPVAISESAASDEVATLWLHRILETPWPIAERMTLFWHNYFAISGARAGRTRLMFAHIELLRKHAMGRFDALLGGVSRDPATMVALGAASNPKGRPPEEFAAALVGRYTTGSNGSVRDVARAFTGTSVLRGEYHEQPLARDDSPKTILGQSGDWAGADAVRILLAHPETPRRVVRRLYAWLIAEDHAPAEALVAPLATAFARDFDIAKLVGTMLRSNLFFSDAAYRKRVKSPLDYATGLMKALNASVPPAQLHNQLALVGQRLCEPPTLDGWVGGKRWLNQFTLVARRKFAASLKPNGVDAGALAELLLESDMPRASYLEIVARPEFQLA